MDVNGDGVADAFGGGSTLLGTSAGGAFTSSGFAPVTDLLSQTDRSTQGLSTGFHFDNDRGHQIERRDSGNTTEGRTVADINGDGRPDLIRMEAGTIKAHLNTGVDIPAVPPGETQEREWGGSASRRSTSPTPTKPAR